jgi:serine/threonine-protein kinase
MDWSARTIRTVSLIGAAAISVILAGPAHADITPYVKLPGIAVCQVDADTVVCEGNWPQAPVAPCPQCPQVMHMDQAVVDVNGNLAWREANIGDPETAGPGWFEMTVLQPYRGYGWTAQMDPDGRTTFVNDVTGHGLGITWVAARDASHAEVSTF